MKGLMYRQLITFRMAIIVLAVTQAYLALMGTVVILNGPDDMRFVCQLSMILPFIMFSVFNSELFRYDEREKWCCFAASTPQAAKGQVLVKYYFTLAVHTVILFVAMLIDCLYVAASNDTSASSVTIGYIAWCISLIMNALEFPFYFRFGSTHGGQVKSASIITIVVLLFVYGLFGDISFFLEGNLVERLQVLFSGTAMLWFSALIAPAALLLFFLSYKLSLKLYRKGMESYEQ